MSRKWVWLADVTGSGVEWFPCCWVELSGSTAGCWVVLLLLRVFFSFWEWQHMVVAMATFVDLLRGRCFGNGNTWWLLWRPLMPSGEYLPLVVPPVERTLNNLNYYYLFLSYFSSLFGDSNLQQKGLMVGWFFSRRYHSAIGPYSEESLLLYLNTSHGTKKQIERWKT